MPLVENTSSCEALRSVRSSGEEGALEELLHSMREYREDSDVQRTACLALRRFAMDDRSGEVLERRGTATTASV